jgi:hypothetical protein
MSARVCNASDSMALEPEFCETNNFAANISTLDAMAILTACVSPSEPCKLCALAVVDGESPGTAELDGERNNRASSERSCSPEMSEDSAGEIESFVVAHGRLKFWTSERCLDEGQQARLP